MEKIRQRGSTDFNSYYDTLCILQNTHPVTSIRACVGDGVFHCHVYRLKQNDWHPLLTALSANRVFRTVVFYDKWDEKALYQLRGM